MTKKFRAYCEKCELKGKVGIKHEFAYMGVQKDKDNNPLYRQFICEQNHESDYDSIMKYQVKRKC